MTKFSYILNPETSLVEKSILETYPDLNILERGLKNGRNVKTIQKGLLKAYEGQAETPIVAIEEKWFDAQSKIQDLTKELYDLNNPVLKQDVNGKDIPLTNEEKQVIEDRKKAIQGYGEVTVVPEKADVTIHIDGELDKATKERKLLEDGIDGDNSQPANKWLKAYRGIEVSETRPTPKNITIPREDIKKLIAYSRDKEVRNLEDSVADIAKEIMLLTSFVDTIYSVLTDEQKSNIPDEKRQILEYGIASFKKTTTRADLQFSSEGIKLIDKLMEREGKIAQIIEKFKD